MNGGNTMGEHLSNSYDAYGDILSVDDVSHLLGISRQSVYSLLGEGKLKGFRLGRGYRIAKTSVVEFVERCSRQLDNT
jgi:excisionase family DNA binding protein